MTKRYTATDFANARFAEHPSGRIAARLYEGDALDWFDSNEHAHTDAALARDGWVPVPTKPTITESDVNKIAFSVFTLKPNLSTIMSWLNRELTDAGVEVIPDPEPTDEELLAGIIRNIDDWQSITSPELLAKYLNTAGVTAPNVKGN